MADNGRQRPLKMKLQRRPSSPLESWRDRSGKRLSLEQLDGDMSLLQRELLRLLQRQIRQGCNINTPRQQRLLAVDWIFTPERVEVESGLSFDLCCRAVGLRPVLLRIRVMYQLYSSCVPLPHPLSPQAVSLPREIEREVRQRSGEVGVRLAKTIWYWPGVRADLLSRSLPAIDDHQRMVVTERLEESGHLARCNGFWFLVGRNPMALGLRGRNRFFWSRAVEGEE